MRHTFAFLTVLMLCASLATAQVTVTLPSQNQVTVNTLPPIGTCFICDCNSTNLECTTACQSITEFTRRQQCDATCGQNLATCLQNAQTLQRAVDDQRAAALSTSTKTQ
ncbi:hypothetical protein [Fundidesulfovibrio agrisoli]|uniref:hypothetical protein n=1 Tax=Fundidesulfovibrio agrisoli TaxID=2922717 RepID=UPI001FAC2BD1|nr:hypothetical protein [Fundidesulfovibrio agrisoli]